MGLPRKVPWTSIAELDQLCSWIYTDEHDEDAKIRAINRLSAWKAITPLPHSLESILALLSALVQDAAPSQPSSHLSLRHSYAAAIIRLVNGLVDPLQLGAYARSIASIANQLGLPPWLVELRHAATHEDLPSLELLRQAARESMTWLLHNYFIPTLNPSIAAPQQAAPLRPLAPILKQYKFLQKVIARDVSVRLQYKQEVKGILRGVERWIAEATIAANVAAGELAWDIGDESVKERWALEKLCDSLMEKGVLVPLSKKKRVFPADSFSPPKFSVDLWSPLLADIHALHPDFPSVLSNAIVSCLLAEASQLEVVSIAVDTTYDSCLARWAMWTVCSLKTADSDADLKKDLVISLITGLGPGSSSEAVAATTLLQALCAGDPEIEAAISVLRRPQTETLSRREWNSDDISVMDQRLATLLAVPDSTKQVELAKQEVRPALAPAPALGPGWRLLDPESGWKPSPIGVYPS
ncbi:Las1-like-domain-containing protein [Roridomyces roridus]|uniref:Las1-like-domain-containing protein n=1 Tax=Roridomyces roridus TaxID=1738132 RepID=A0AAD7BTR9_9AGAR|nr:Las1-like-domain-containing protein [Roridomyces roridus]